MESYGIPTSVSFYFRWKYVKPEKWGTMGDPKMILPMAQLARAL
jgi:hypothetical protein